MRNFYGARRGVEQRTPEGRMAHESTFAGPVGFLATMELRLYGAAPGVGDDAGPFFL